MFSRGYKEGGPVTSEATLFLQAQGGCLDSLNILMAHHDRLVNAVVRQQVLGDLPFDEALHAGRIGLWHAILGYDPSRGTAFSTYAWVSIMRRIWREVKVHTRPPPAQSDGFTPCCEPDPADLWEEKKVQEALYDLIERLPGRLRRVIVMRYGLDGSSPATYRQIGAQLGFSHELARLLHNDALVWMRHPAYSQLLRSLLGRHTVEDYELADATAQCWLRKRGGRNGR